MLGRRYNKNMNQETIATVLIIDDDKELCQLLAEYLLPEGFQLRAIHDGKIDITKVKAYDIIILDIMLPDRVNGLDILKMLRANNIFTPVLMLTGRGEEIDRIVGLECGADDYLGKPCSPRELLAHLRAIIRRKEQIANNSSQSMVSVGDLVCQSQSRVMKYQNHTLDLTTAEFNILELLIAHAGKSVNKEILAEKALFRKLSPYDRAIDIHISNIRKKLLQAGQDPCHIKTLRGIGYLYQVY